jgi:hypothetical protein
MPSEDVRGEAPSPIGQQHPRPVIRCERCACLGNFFDMQVTFDFSMTVHVGSLGLPEKVLDEALNARRE